jgi:hypothetical protein
MKGWWKRRAQKRRMRKENQESGVSWKSSEENVSPMVRFAIFFILIL